MCAYAFSLFELLIGIDTIGHLIGHISKGRRMREKLEQYLQEATGGAPRLVICGGGYVAIAVVKIGQMTGFSVTVLEDRPLYADHARAAGADKVICDTFENGLAQIAGGENTYFVVVTRGHRYDKECLKCICGKEAAYVGMIGSRRRVAMLKEQLLTQGICREWLEALHAPIGLDIGAETPEEIAVAIMAEIISEKNRGGNAAVFSSEQQEAMRRALQADEQLVLATITAREGSAPRQVGTRMLVQEDGACIGTIGGGCMEAEVQREARSLLAGGSMSEKTLQLTLRTDEAAEEGMVCGGTLTILLELL